MNIFFWIIPDHSVYAKNDRRIKLTDLPISPGKKLILGKLRSRYHHRFEYHSDRPIADSAFHHGSARRQDRRLHRVLYPADCRNRVGHIDSFRELEVDAVLLVLPCHGGPREKPLHR